MKTIYRLSFLLILLSAILTSCEDDMELDFHSPNLDLIVSNIETGRTLEINEKTTFDLTFKNAKGDVSYIWTMSGKIISNDKKYTFQSSEPGVYTINVYTEDSEGKYANTSFIIKVLDDSHVFSDEKVVVGYFPSYRTGDVEWDKITHFIYAFVYPKEDGTLDTSEMTNLALFVTQANANNVKILVSVGGASYPGKDVRVFTSVISDETKLATFVNSINVFVRNNNLDGIDVDYEELVGGGATVDNADTNKLLPFYKKLRETLPSKSLITAAVTGGTWWQAYHFRDITTEMAKVLDFISVMSYDNYGTWSGSPLGDPSALPEAKGALNRYVEFGAPKNKLVLGVPFYGRDFLTATGGIANPITYSDIISTYSPTNEELNSGRIDRDGHNIFFNSQKVISQKATYIKDNDFKGITIWEMGQDTDIKALKLLNDILSIIVK